MSDDLKQAANLQQKYGFDVAYDPKEDMFMLHQNKNGDMLLVNQDIDISEWNDSHLDDMTDTFSEKSKIEYKDVDLYKAIRDDQALLSASYSGDNIITVYNYQMDEDDREDCIQMLVEKYEIDEEKAKAGIELLLHGKDNAASFLSYIEHEGQHLHNHKNSGARQYDLPPEYMAKIDMMDEISANMSQAGLALDMYKATGNVKYFDDLAIDTKDLQKALQENPDMENKEAFVAKYVNDKWLETHNNDKTLYSQQAYNIASPQYWDYPVWAMAENSNTIKQYHERVDAMFENIMGLGDVRKYVTPDFELNSALKQQLAEESLIDAEILKKIMVQDAQNAEQYSENMTAFFNKIREIDIDGVRTPEEAAMLDEYIKQSVQKYDMAHTSPESQTEKPNFAVTAAIKKGRER